MIRNTGFLLLLIVFFIIGNSNSSFAQCASTNSLTTFYGTNNQQDGIMFDVTASATSSVTIKCFEINLDAGTYDFEIYYKTGTHVGFENNAAAWTLAGTANGVVSSGSNNATYIPALINVNIPCSQRYAFYITTTGTGTGYVKYTNGTGVGNVLATNASLTIYEGTGKDYAFSSNYTPRQFNGTVYYDVTGGCGCNLTVNDTTICEGDMATLNVSSSVAGTTYLWSTGGTNSSINVSPTTTTVYTVTGTASGSTCTASATVTVNPLPSVTASASPSSICEGDGSTLTANGANTYIWSTTGTGSSISVSPTSTTTYNVTGTDVNGCSNTGDVLVTVNPLPNVSASANPASICSGYTTDLSATGASSYVWSTSATGSPITVTPGTTTTYYVTGTDANGCSDMDSVLVSVTQSPTINITTTPETCDDINGTATANPSGGVAPYQYEWSTSPVQTTNPATNLVSNTYTVTVTDDNGCTATADAIVGSHPSFTINSTSTDEHCNLMDGSADVTVSGATSPLTYTWSHDPGLNSPGATGLSAGTYTVTVDDGTCQEIIDITVYAIPGPIAGFMVNPTQADIENAFFMVTDLSIGATSWLYYFDDGGSSTMQNPTHEYTSEGDYTITQYVYDDYGCVDSTTMTVSVEGLFAFYIPNAFSPNGDNINDYFLPKGIGIDADTWHMKIYDRWGSTVFVSTDINQPWDGMYVLEDIDKTPTAVFGYFITFRTESGLIMEYYGHVTTLP